MTRRANRGLTLVETAFGIAVLTLGVLGAASALTSTLQLSREARETMVAAQDLQAAAELVRGTSFGKLGQPGSLPATLPAGPLSQFNDLNLKGERVTLAYSFWDSAGVEVPLDLAALPSPPPQQLQFQLTITWSSATTGAAQRVPTSQWIAGIRTAAE